MTLIVKRSFMLFVSALIVFTIITILLKMFLVVSEYDDLQKQSWGESPWASSQAQFELERLRLALLTAQVEPSEDNLAAAVLRLNVFWSRLDILAQGPNQDVLQRAALAAVYYEIFDYLIANKQAFLKLTPYGCNL